MTIRVTKIALAAFVLGLTGLAAPPCANSDASVVYNYYGAAPARRIANRTASSPVVVERVVSKPVVVQRVVERRVIVHKRHKGLVPKAYSMIFGG